MNECMCELLLAARKLNEKLKSESLHHAIDFLSKTLNNVLNISSYEIGLTVMNNAINQADKGEYTQEKEDIQKLIDECITRLYERPDEDQEIDIRTRCVQLYVKLEDVHAYNGGLTLSRHIEEFSRLPWDGRKPEMVKDILRSIDNILMLPCYSDALSQEARLMISNLIRVYDIPKCSAVCGKEGGEVMKVSELYTLPLINVIHQMEMKDFNVYSDNSGNIQSIEVKYIPKQDKEENQ